MCSTTYSELLPMCCLWASAMLLFPVKSLKFLCSFSDFNFSPHFLQELFKYFCFSLWDPLSKFLCVWTFLFLSLAVQSRFWRSCYFSDSYLVLYIFFLIDDTLFLYSWFHLQRLWWLCLTALLLLHRLPVKWLFISLIFNTLTIIESSQQCGNRICLLFGASATGCCFSITLTHLFVHHLNYLFPITSFLPTLACNHILADDLISLTNF